MMHREVYQKKPNLLKELMTINLHFKNLQRSSHIITLKKKKKHNIFDEGAEGKLRIAHKLTPH